MRASHRLNLFLALVLLTLARLPAADTVPFTDGVGRTIQLPAKIERIYATSPVAAIYIYSLAPGKMAGWNYKLGRAEAHYLLPEVRNLPVLGGWFGENGKGNRETLLAAKPDVILSIGYNDRTSIEFADRLQAQVGIPVAVASGTLEDSAATYELIGNLCGAPEQARTLAAYCRRALSEAKAFAAAIPPEQRLRVYYAEGLRGLQTDTKGSMHTEVLDVVGAENVAQGAATSGFGRASVSLEQVIAWKPDAILVCPEKLNPDGNWRPEWLGTHEWSQVKAVACSRVYVIPGAPFNWFDRPPAPSRFLGLKWVEWVLYPDRVKFDLVAETREFYRLFYHYDLSETEAWALLDASRPKPATPSQ
jgi:iron complex transport system substrate-binding protein